MPRSSPIKKIWYPPLAQLEGRFIFIDNALLRSNLAVTLQYIIFLIGIGDTQKVSGSTVGYGLHRDLIIHSASAVEALLHFCLMKLVQDGKIDIKKIGEKKWVVQDVKYEHKFNDAERIRFIVEKGHDPVLNQETRFREVNNACKKVGVISETLHQRTTDLGNQRNKIHLMGLAGNEKFSGRESNKAFVTLGRVLERVEAKLK